MPSHTHGTGKTSSASTYPEYYFTVNRSTSTSAVGRMGLASGSSYYAMGTNTSASDSIGIDDIIQISKTGATGEGKAFSNMPPYYVAYMWKRVA